jgi:hypothetical protein
VLTPVLALAMALVVVVVMVMKAYSSEGYVLLGLAAAHLSNSSTWDQWDQLSVLPPTMRSECAPGFADVSILCWQRHQFMHMKEHAVLCL